MTYKLWLPGHPGTLREEGIWPPRFFTHRTEPWWLQLNSVGSKKFWTSFTSFFLDRKATSIHNPVKSLYITTDHIFITSDCSIPLWNGSLQGNMCSGSWKLANSCHSSSHFGSFWFHHPVLTTCGHSRNWCEHSTGKFSCSHASRAESPLTPGSFWSSHWLYKAWN